MTRHFWSGISAIFLIGFAVLVASPALAATPTPLETAQMFNTAHGDGMTSIFLNQMFGPLFPSVSGSGTATVFSELIGFFNITCMVIGGMLFMWNVTIGILQTAHEGSILGQRWSTLWAPIRLIFAVGLLIPLGHLGGYNLAQSGVAYLARGATNIASAAWSAGATMVLDGVTPITARAPNIRPTLITAMFENEACIQILNAQLGRMAQQTQKPTGAVQSSVMTTPNSSRQSDVTFMRDAAGNDHAHGICGKVTTPDTPFYIKNIANTNLQGVPTNQRQQIETAFSNAHINVINLIRNGSQTNDIKGVTQIVSDMMPMALDNGRPLANIQDDIAKLHAEVNRKYHEDINALLDLAVGQNRQAQGARDALRARITGNCANPAPPAAGGQAPPANQPPANCYGEGWLGAGSWYIMLAQLNNEIASLTNAEVEVTTGSYIKDVDSAARDAYIAAGGEQGGWFSWFSGNSTEENMADNGFSSEDEVKLWQARIMQSFSNSTAGLAALGYTMSHENMQSLMRSGEPSSMNDILSYIPFLSEGINNYGTLVLAFFSPSSWANDPMIGMISIGNFLLTMAASLNVAAMLAGWVSGGASGMVFAPFSNTLLIAGGTLAFMLPMMPFFYWVLAVTGYFLLIVEAVIAVNLWAIGHLRMDGEGVSGEAGKMGWLMLLSLTLTPVLMIFGFFVGMVLFRVTVGLINIGMGNVYTSLMGGNIFSQLFGLVAITLMMAMIYVTALERSFSLVSELPGRVLRWMGADANITNGEENRARMGAAAAVGAMAKGSTGIPSSFAKGGGFLGGSKVGNGNRDENNQRIPGLYRQYRDRKKANVRTPDPQKNNDGSGGSPPKTGG